MQTATFGPLERRRQADPSCFRDNLRDIALKSGFGSILPDLNTYLHGLVAIPVVDARTRGGLLALLETEQLARVSATVGALGASEGHLCAAPCRVARIVTTSALDSSDSPPT